MLEYQSYLKKYVDGWDLLGRYGDFDYYFNESEGFFDDKGAVAEVPSENNRVLWSNHQVMEPKYFYGSQAQRIRSIWENELELKDCDKFEFELDYALETRPY